MISSNSTTKEAIRQRLMYSFGFTYAQSEVELSFLFINGCFVTEEYYVKKQCRIGQTKLLTRAEKQQIHKYCKAILEENTEILEICS